MSQLFHAGSAVGGFLIASKQRILVILTLCVCAICIYEKIHFSSVGMWNSYLRRDAQVPGLVSGAPQAIRSDEWMLGVPWQLSQAATNPSWTTNNAAVGLGTAALLVGLPTNHWSAIFRPAHWGFYFLDSERAFSWMWMWRSVVVFSAFMLLFLELTSGSWACALAGAAWIFFSGFVQWWLASVAEMLAYWALACVALRYIFVARSAAVMLGASVLLLIAAGGFGLSLYPPFQVPLAYLGFALLPFLLRGAMRADGPSIWLRVGVCSVTVALGLAALVVFMIENAAAVSVMENTVYPGRRVSLGGDLSLWRYVASFFERSYTQFKFPPIAGNICEASSFLLLWPVALTLVPFFSETRQIVRFVPLVAYLVLTTLWGLFGVTESLALATGWSFVPTSRAILGWGVGGALMCILAMNEPTRATGGMRTLFVLAVVVLVTWCVEVFPGRFPADIPISELRYSGFLVALAACALIVRSRWALIAALLFLCAVPHSQVNPVMRGLAVFADVPLLQAVKRFDPNREGRWAVFGSLLHAQLVKVTGRVVVNGSQYIPDMKSLRALDPDGEHAQVYNRYAHVVFSVGPQGSAPAFTLHAPDTWELQVDPCDQRFQDYGVRYLVWNDYSAARNFACYERVFVGKDFAIYKSR